MGMQLIEPFPLDWPGRPFAYGEDIIGRWVRLKADRHIGKNEIDARGSNICKQFQRGYCFQVVRHTHQGGWCNRFYDLDGFPFNESEVEVLYEAGEWEAA